MTTEPTLSDVLTQIRLHHVLSAISVAHYGDTFSMSLYEGDASEGRYAMSDGQGDECWASWGGGGVVVLAFDHYDPGNQFRVPVAERDLSMAFYGAPTSVAKLIADVTKFGDGLGSASIWVARREDGSTSFGSCGSADILAPFAMDPVTSLEEGRALREFFSVSVKQGALAVDLARRAAGAPIVLTAAEKRTLRAHPPYENAELSKDQWEEATRMLRALHIYVSATAIPTVTEPAPRSPQR